MRMGLTGCIVEVYFVDGSGERRVFKEAEVEYQGAERENAIEAGGRLHGDWHRYLVRVKSETGRLSCNRVRF